MIGNSLAPAYSTFCVRDVFVLFVVDKMYRRLSGKISVVLLYYDFGWIGKRQNVMK